jgi:hypothetical protein
MPEFNIEKKIQNASKTAEEYKDMIVEYFKDMNVDVKKWNFSVGKVDGTYEVEIQLKLSIKPK